MRIGLKRLRGDRVLGDKSSGVKPRERDSPSISLVGQHPPFSLRSSHPRPTKHHCDKCGVGMPTHRGVITRHQIRVRNDGRLLCWKCSRLRNFSKILKVKT